MLDEGNCNNFRGNIIDQSTTYAAYEYDEYENAYEKSAVLWLANPGRIDWIGYYKIIGSETLYEN